MKNALGGPSACIQQTKDTKALCMGGGAEATQNLPTPPNIRFSMSYVICIVLFNIMAVFLNFLRNNVTCLAQTHPHRSQLSLVPGLKPLRVSTPVLKPSFCFQSSIQNNLFSLRPLVPIVTKRHVQREKNNLAKLAAESELSLAYLLRPYPLSS